MIIAKTTRKDVFFKHKLFKNIMIFTLSTVLNKGLNFFILPVLTYHLTKSDYGVLGFVMSVVTITSIYVGLWPTHFIMAKFHKLKKETLARYISNIYILVFVTFFIVFSLLLSTKDILFTNLHEPIMMITTIMFYTLFTVFSNILYAIIQLEKNALKYAYIQALYSLLSIGLALFLIIKLNKGWEGKIYAELTMLSVISLYSFYYLFSKNYFLPNFSIKKLKTLFNYLFPMTFYVIGVFLLVTVDKVILAKYTTIEAVGIYTIAMTMSILLNIIFESIMNAWSPYIYEKLSTQSHHDKVFLKKTLLGYSAFVILVVGVYILIVPYLFEFMIDKKFHSSLNYTTLLILGFGFEGLRKPLTVFLMHKNQVKELAYISIFVALLNITLNIILIQRYNIYGATVATLTAFVFQYILTAIIVKKRCTFYK